VKAGGARKVCRNVLDRIPHPTGALMIALCKVPDNALAVKAS
jgi:hypothetical protein